MRGWPRVLKFLGYLWLTFQIVLVQFVLGYRALGGYEPGMTPGYVLLMLVLAAPGIAMLVLAEKLDSKGASTP